MKFLRFSLMNALTARCAPVFSRALVEPRQVNPNLSAAKETAKMVRILTSTLVTVVRLQLAYGGPRAFFRLGALATVAGKLPAGGKAPFNSGIPTQAHVHRPTFCQLNGTGVR